MASTPSLDFIFLITIDSGLTSLWDIDKPSVLKTTNDIIE